MLGARAIFGVTTNILINSSMSSAMVTKQASLDVSMTQQDIVTIIIIIIIMLLLYFVMRVSV